MKKTLVIAVALFVLISIIVIIGNIITIGEKMTSAIGVPYLEYAFYIILLGIFAYLVYMAILQPMMTIHHAPAFPVLSVEENSPGLSDAVYRKKLMSFANKLCDNCYYLPTSEREKHQSELKQELARVSPQDINELKEFIVNELKQRYSVVDKEIMKYGSRVFLITAISSSNRIDTLATLGLNYRMVADIVRASGFRPNKLQLIKIYYYVISSAFLSYFFQGVSDTVDNMAEGISDAADIDVSDAEIPDVDVSGIDFTQYAKDMHIPFIPLAPLADGLANAVMTVAIGYITKYYLQKGPKELKGAKGRAVKLKSRVKAIQYIPKLFVEVTQQAGNAGLSWAIKGFEGVYSNVINKSKAKESSNPFDEWDAFKPEVETTQEESGLLNKMRNWFLH